ncbi:MAG TPA: hypothetical protein VGK88_07470 [bacterium]|jgi:hypothetical protein
MGQAAACTVTYHGEVSEGNAFLETDGLIFRGTFRLSIPYRAMQSIRAVDGVLTIRFPGGPASFALGPQAARWADRILHPKSRIDKLGVRPGQRVAVLGVTDRGFLGELRAVAGRTAPGRAGMDAAHVFLQADSQVDLRRLGRAARMIAPDGAVWLITPRAVRSVTEAHALAAGRSAGLTDVKVVRFSDTQTAHKFVIPRSARRPS